jgi:DHA1 family inner membrane transport protein
VLAALAPQNLTAKKTDGLLNGWVAEIRLAALLPLVSKPPMNRTLNILGFLIFASALSVRAIDPVVPQIAADLSVSLNTAALLAAGFAAYWLVQPVLGPVADAFGKARVMIACLLLLAVSSFLSAIVTDFWLLFALRVLAGAACGGSFPIGMALISDFVPLAQRQVTIGRLLGATISGNLLGAAISGVIADFIHWRGMFIGLGVISLVALALGVYGLRGLPRGEPQPLNLRAVLARNRAIFAIPAARICYGTVALEALFLFGIFPYAAVLLLQGGEPRASIAGLVVAAFAVGGLIYSVSVPQLLRLLGQKRIMMAGGMFGAIGLFIVATSPPWPGLRLRPDGARLLHAAREHSGLCHRVRAGDAKLGGGVPHLLVLCRRRHQPGALRLWPRPLRCGHHAVDRRGGDDPDRHHQRAASGEAESRLTLNAARCHSAAGAARRRPAP